MYAELFSGLHDDPRVHLQKFFTEKYDEVVLVKDISFNSMCEHHMLPFMGQAHVGYLPNGRVVGLSKIARVIEVVSQPAASPGTNDRDDRRLAGRGVTGQGGGRGDRGLAFLHDGTRRAQAGERVRHLGHAGRISLEPVEPVRDHELDLRQPSLRGIERHAVLILIQFILRLSFGMAAAMTLVSPRLVSSGYYRNNLYVLLGLNVLAALAAGGTESPLWPAATAAAISYAGAVCWLYERPRLGLSALGLVAVFDLVALWQTPAAESISAGTVLTVLDPITGGLLLGATMAAMLLGHWYLNAPGMALAPLVRLIGLLAVAVLLRAGVCAAGLSSDVSSGGWPDAGGLLFLACAGWGAWRARRFWLSWRGGRSKSPIRKARPAFSTWP